MKPQNSFNNCILGFVISLLSTFFLLSTPALSYADPFDDMIDTLRKIDEVLQKGNKSFKKITGYSPDDLEAAKGLIECLANSGGDDLEITHCLSNDNGETLNSDKLQTFADAYIKLRTGDYLGFALTFGKEVVCAVMQVMSGTNICALLEAIAELAEDLYDAAKAVLQFLKDVGGAFADFYCGTVSWGCDDDGIPLFLLVYEKDFHPFLGLGVQNQESDQTGASFGQYLKELKEKAKAKADDFDDLAAKNAAAADYQHRKYSNYNVNKAAEAYVDNTIVQWSNHITNVLDGERRELLQNYDLGPLLASALAQYSPGTPWYLHSIIVPQIYNLLMSNHYGHIDRWKSTDLGRASLNKSKYSVQTNTELAENFINGNEIRFVRNIEKYILDKGSCHLFGSSILCNDSAEYLQCVELLSHFKAVSSPKPCQIDMRVAGKDAVEKMTAKFREKGSKYFNLDFKSTNLDIKKSAQLKPGLLSSKPLQGPTNEPWNFTLYRGRIHQYYFDQFYKQLFPNNPQKLLNPVLQEDPAYKKLRESVASAVEQLNEDFQAVPLSLGLFATDARDPLLVWAKSPLVYKEVQEAKPEYLKNFLFSNKAQLLQNAADGLNRPVIRVDYAGYNRALLGDPLREELTLEDIRDIDPMDRFEMISKADLLKNTTIIREQGGPTLPKTDFSVAANDKRMPEKGVVHPSIAGNDILEKLAKSHKNALKTSAATPGLSGANKTKSSSDKTKTTMSMMAPVFADLKLEETLYLANKKGRWGSMVSITDNKGACDAVLKYSVINAGEAVSAGFKTKWFVPNGNRPVSKAPLKAGEKRVETERLQLVPGVNRFTLMIDSSNQIKEQDETNNRYNLIVRVDGKCGKKTLPATTLRPTVQSTDSSETEASGGVPDKHSMTMPEKPKIRLTKPKPSATVPLRSN